MRRETVTLTERPDVPRSELWASPTSRWVGERVMVGTGHRKAVCRVVASPSGKPHPQESQMFCGPIVSRRLLGPGTMEGSVVVARVSALGALWADSDSKWPLLRATALLLVGVLAFVGLGVPDDWSWWPWVPGVAAIVAALSSFILDVRRLLP